MVITNTTPVIFVRMSFAYENERKSTFFQKLHWSLVFFFWTIDILSVKLSDEYLRINCFRPLKYDLRCLHLSTT
jgi:hypothetical protein